MAKKKDSGEEDSENQGRRNSALLKEAMLKALEQSLGIVTQAAAKVGIDRQTHYNWLKSDKEYRKRFKELENVALDFAETQLHKQISKGNPLSTIFYLKCRARKRGYIEQQDIKIQGNMKFKADFGTGDPLHSAPESTDNP